MDCTVAPRFSPIQTISWKLFAKRDMRVSIVPFHGDEHTIPILRSDLVNSKFQG